MKGDWTEDGWKDMRFDPPSMAQQHEGILVKCVEFRTKVEIKYAFNDCPNHLVSSEEELNSYWKPICEMTEKAISLTSVAFVSDE